MKKSVEYLKTIFFGTVGEFRSVKNATLEPPNVEDVKKALEAVTGLRLSGITANAVQTELVLDNSDVVRFEVPASSSVGFKAMVAARQTAGSGGTVGDSAVFTITGLIKRDGAGNTAMVDTAVSKLTDAGAGEWAAVAQADDNNNALVLKVTGEANKTISWNALIEYRIAN